MYVFGLLPNLRSENFAIIGFLYLLCGICFFKPKYKLVFPKIAYKLIYWIYLGIFLSMIMALLFYHQSIIQSIITYRVQILLLSPFLLFKLAPSKQEIIKSLEYFAWIYLFANLLIRSVPGLTEIDYTEEGHGVLGYEILPILIYYYLQRMGNKFEAKPLIYCFLIIILIFIQQNRSTLFPILLITGFSLLRIKSRYRILLIIVIGMIVATGIVYSYEILRELITETQDQLSDPTYARNLALEYFLLAPAPNFLCDIFGHGLISSNTSSIVEALKEQEIFTSDVGFIGYWHEYGLIPIFVFLYLYISALVKRRVPYYLKCTSVQILACSLTISYFGITPHMIFFILFYYLYFLEQARPKATKSPHIRLKQYK